MKKIAMLLAASALLVGMVAPAGAAKPKLVWEDATDDAGPPASGPAPVFTAAGLDLVSGSIVKNGANLEFTVTHAGMPPIGSLPEGARFLWNFNVGTTLYRLTVKSVDIGKPDVVGGQTTDRLGRADVNGHFRLEGECEETATPAVTIVNCPPLAYLEGVWDPGAMSFTVLVPLKEIKAKTGSVISGGAEQICTICWVSHVAERSHTQTLIDTAVQTTTYKVPKK